MIEDILPGNKTRLKILQAIYENPEINITNLIKKTKASPNFALSYVNKLSLYKIISEERNMGKKKAHIRNLRANFSNEIARMMYAFVEINKKILFLEKYKELKPYLLQMEEILEGCDAFILVYGSFARFAASEDSDLDVLITGKLEKEKINRIREIFVTFGKEVSLKVDNIKSFTKNKDKPLYQNILKEHIVVFGTIKFVNVLEKVYNH